jgi:hypothetical protein
VTLDSGNFDPASMITIAGAGTVSTGSGYNGGWTVESGTLRVTASSGLGFASPPQNVLVDGGAKLWVDGVEPGRAATLADGATLLGSNGTEAATVAANASVTFGTVGATTLTVNGLSGGSGSTAHVAGPGTVVLPSSVPSTPYAGDWSLDGGQLKIFADAQLGATGEKVTLAGGTLLLGGSVTSARSITVAAAGGTIDVGTSTGNFTGTITGAGTLAKAGPGLMTVKNVRAGGLNVTTGTMKVLPDGTAAGVSRVASLAVGAAAKLDLTNNAIVVAGGDVGSFDGAAYTGVSGLVAVGRNGGTWDRAGGIVTSDARRANDYASLGVVTASDALGLSAAATQVWGGQTVQGSDVLVAFTYGGDANLDGVINIDDYSQIDGSVAVGGALKGWFNGDFNYDGEVNIDDYSIIDGNIGIQDGSLARAGDASRAGAAVTAVPEPAGVGLLVAGGGVLLGRRRGRMISRAGGA